MCIRCEWPLSSLDIEYHDKEWGVPEYDDKILFEFLILENMQAGLSWSTILKKRENMRMAFSNFDIITISQYDETYKNELLQNVGIIRNRLKINALVSNANKFIAIQKEYSSFSKYIWQFVDNKPIQNKWKSHSEVPASTPLSNKISADLKKRGFKFFGTTICYAFMQATGMVNDHIIKCYRYKEVKQL